MHGYNEIMDQAASAPTKKYYCHLSGKELSPERVEALRMLGTPERMWTHVEHSQARRKKIAYIGDGDSTDMLIANSVDDRPLAEKPDTEEEEAPIESTSIKDEAD